MNFVSEAQDALRNRIAQQSTNNFGGGETSATDGLLNSLLNINSSIIQEFNQHFQALLSSLAHTLEERLNN